MRGLWPRNVTSLCIIVACALVMSSGFDFVRFVLAERNLDPDRSNTQEIRGWTNVPGVAAAARADLVAPVLRPGDLPAILKQREALTDFLAIRPLSARRWLALAETRAIAGNTPEQVVNALNLSVLTGPNEGLLMPDRALFGLSLWELLPPVARRTVVGELAALSADDTLRSKLSVVLSAKSSSARREIREALAIYPGLRDFSLAAFGRKWIDQRPSR